MSSCLSACVSPWTKVGGVCLFFILFLKAIHYRKYSSASDVWSYGVLMFEIWGIGCHPYEGLSIQQVRMHAVLYIWKFSVFNSFCNEIKKHDVCNGILPLIQKLSYMKIYHALDQLG